ncbi:cwf21-domain-containing protein [Lentithecium fluviatile CBS 122367]|uniref:Cwf21-domain-containing protein n=1 Tax=Lentithecium fluviatile CBS 122367 TaxID=1168545 RepID=A0A6G1JEG5_9PLEO|nr:cwf21-domain-containing protein [Lentithecium fluviatile CBS 122367]
MSSNVGLSTPRGSGTSGYVTKNKSLLKPRDRAAPYPDDWQQSKHRARQPDAEILEHERKREIEVKVLELRDKLEDEGVDDDEIDDQCDALRKKLQDERKAGKDTGPDVRKLKSHQVHDLAKAKNEESERLRKALGISADYEEGSHWRKQEERLRDSLAQRERDDEARVERARETRRLHEEED